MEENIDTILLTYSPSEEAVALLKKVPILLLVGISGAGKDTILNRLLKTEHYHQLVSYTTRAPRENNGVLEREGSEYHFIDKATVLRMLQERQFIEANRYVGNIYGTGVDEFQKAHDGHRIAVTDIDINGAAHMHHLSPESTRPVFLTPPSFDVWHQRWTSRYGDGSKYNHADYAGRLQTAIDEIEHVLAVDYYSIVINDELDDAVTEVDSIANTGVQDATHREQAKEVLRTILADMKADL